MRWFEYFKALFRSKATVATTAIFSIAYYFLIEYVIGLNATNGYVFVTVPPILIYLLAFTSGLLLTITIHSIRLSISRIQTEIEGAASMLTAVFGGVIAGCNCAVPILASLMYLLALNAATVSTVLSFIGSYQTELFSLLILLNLLLSYHHLSKISSTCAIRKGRIVRIKK